MKKGISSHNNDLRSVILEDIKKQKWLFILQEYNQTYRITPRKIKIKPKTSKIIRHRKNQTLNVDLINTKLLLSK